MSANKVILRYPALAGDETISKERLSHMLETNLVTVRGDPVLAKLYIRPSDVMVDYFGNGVKQWIITMLMDPDTHKAPADVMIKDYTLSLFTNGIVFANVFPCGTVANAAGEYEFAYQMEFSV